MTDDHSSQGQTWPEMGCGRDGWGRPLQNIRLHVTAGCRETFGKHQERESNRLVALGSDQALCSLFLCRRNGAVQPAPLGGLGVILAKHHPDTGLVPTGVSPLPLVLAASRPPWL